MTKIEIAQAIQQYLLDHGITQTFIKQGLNEYTWLDQTKVECSSDGILAAVAKVGDGFIILWHRPYGTWEDKIELADPAMLDKVLTNFRRGISNEYEDRAARSS